MIGCGRNLIDAFGESYDGDSQAVVGLNTARAAVVRRLIEGDPTCEYRMHWDAGRIGVVLTIAGVATVCARAGRRARRCRSLEANIDRDRRPSSGHPGRRDGLYAAILAHCSGTGRQRNR